MNDKNGKDLKDGQTVLVPEPINDDLWIHSFSGTVKGTHANCISVCDQDGDYWDVEANRLEVTNR